MTKEKLPTKAELLSERKLLIRRLEESTILVNEMKDVLKLISKDQHCGQESIRLLATKTLKRLFNK